MLNKVMLIGRLGNDPEVRVLPSGEVVANLSLATSEVWNDRASGQKQERTEWHRIVCYGRTAEVCRDYLSKGRQVYVEGSIHYRKWQDQNGNERYSTEIKCQSLQMLGSKNDVGGGMASPTAPATGSETARPTAPASQRPTAPTTPSGGFNNDIDEDIPF